MHSQSLNAFQKKLNLAMPIFDATAIAMMYTQCFAIVKCTVVNIALSYIVGASWFFVITLIMAAIRAETGSHACCPGSSHRDVVLTKTVVASALSSTVCGMAIKFAMFTLTSAPGTQGRTV